MRCRIATGASPDRRARRARVGAALALALAAATGCGPRALRHRSEPVERREEPRLTEVQKQILAAREQMALDAKEPYWPYRLGQIYAEADSLAQAEAALQASLRRDPTYAPALSLLSKLWYDARRHAEAVRLLESARARPGAFPEGVPRALLAGLALHYEALGRHHPATALVGATPGSEPTEARSAAAYLTLRGENRETAAELASEAVDHDPNSAANQNNHGIARLRAGDVKAARKAFLRAIELDPRLPGPYYNLVILERHYLFDEQAAAKWLAAYRERASEDPDGLFGATGEVRPIAGKGGE
jgi:tetratricopeptide (TPR) repeat protein